MLHDTIMDSYIMTKPLLMSIWRFEMKQRLSRSEASQDPPDTEIMKKLIWAIMQIGLGCCGLYTVVNSLTTDSDNLVLGIMISIWSIPGVQTMREYLQEQKRKMQNDEK